jgi:predicted enzyme related to lactoylglutathione lyase
VLRFYSRVLSTGERPLWREDLMNNQGTPIIGLGARNAEHANLPLQWMPHIQVADVAESAACALELGATELMHSRNDAGESEWGVLLDPNGAAFGIVPIVSAETIGASNADPSAAPDAVGRIGWLDLTVPNAAATRDFYCRVIGWSAQDVGMTDAGERYADFNMLDGDGNAAAGVCHARGVNTGLAPAWMIYLPVGDLAESVRRVESDGGTVIKSMRGTNGQYQYVAVEDPAGACFALAPGGNQGAE